MRPTALRSVLAAAVLVAVLSVVGCGGGGYGAGPTPAPAPDGSGGAAGGNTIAIQNFAFIPAELTVTPGTTVTWQNKDSVSHTVTGTGFDSGPISAGSSYTHTFPAAGVFAFRCKIHPSMAPGKITVK